MRSCFGLVPGLLLVAGLGLLSAAGCGGTQQPVTSQTSKFQVETGPNKPDGETPAEVTPPTAPPAEGAPSTKSPLNAGKPKPLAPPKVPGNPGDSPEAVKMLQALVAVMQKQPEGANEAELRQSMSELLLARTQIAFKLLQTQASERTKQGAIEAFIEANVTLQELGDANAMQRVTEFANLAAGLVEPGIAKRGRQMQHEIAVATCVMSRGEGYEQVEKTIDALVKEGKNKELYSQLQQSVDMFVQGGQIKPAQATLERLLKEFVDTEDAEIKADLPRMRDMVTLVESDFDPALVAAFQGEEGAAAKLLAKCKELLAVESRGPMVIERMTKALALFEWSDAAAAAELADALKAAYEKHPETKLVDAAAEYADSSHKRIALVGKEFPLPAQPHDGAAFDWASYRGKVVLIDFWATWCVPCLQELPNIKSAFDKYHDQGFEVLGVNMDQDREQLARFLSLQPLPWTTLVLPVEGKESPFKSEFSKSLGVQGIPFVILIDKDGKVDSLHVRGDRLEKRLEKLLAASDKAPLEGNSSVTPPARPNLNKPAEPAGDDVPVNSLRPKTIKRTSAEEDVKDEAPEPPAKSTCGDEPAAENAANDEKVNPYAAKPGWSNEKLTDYVLKMQEKPKSIRNRNGFSEAMIECCERVLANKPSDVQALIAIESKAELLQKWAAFGGPEVEKKTREFVAAFREDTRPRAKKAIDVLDRELQLADAVQGPLDGVPALLKNTQEYFETEKLDGRHLRLASNTVALINRLEDGDLREEKFKEFGGLFAKSKDKELARYGKKLAKSVPQSEFVGQEIQLTGVGTDGAAFDIKSLRGKVVVVDFWATWCGPCKKELPKVEAIYQQRKDRGLEVVGVSLDADADDLAAFLAEHPLPWKTLAGEGNQATAEKYGVRGIPTLMLIDKEGKIRAVAHSIEQLTGQMDKLLAG